MNAWVRRALGGGIAAGVLSAIALSALADEPGSSFSGENAGRLGDDARTLGFAVHRGVSTVIPPGPEDAQDTLVVVLSAPKPYSDAEIRRFRSFLDSGGAALVVDGEGHGTQLAAVAGLAFERVRLHEPTGHLAGELLGRPFSISAENSTAVKIMPGASAEILLSSSPDSHIDRDADGAIGLSDPPGPYPVLVSAAVGKGSLWALSAPGGFDARLADDPGHVAFRRVLLSLAMEDRTSLRIDESRIPSDDPLVTLARAAVQVTGFTPWREGALAVAGLAAVFALLVSAAPVWGPHGFRPRQFLGRSRRQGPVAARTGWTRRGCLVLALGAVLAVAGFAAGSEQATWAASFCLAAAAAALALPRPRGHALRSLSIERTRESSNLEVRVEAAIKGSLAGVQIRDRLASTLEVTAGHAWGRPSAPAVTLDYALRPARLGRCDIGPLMLMRRDVLSLYAAQATILDATPMDVLPRIDSARRTPFSSRVPRILLGKHLVPRAGSGSEFHSLRGYEQGDSIRSVNWKASARSKSLVVNQRVHESQTELTVLLDTRAVSDVGPAEATPFVVGARIAASVTSGAKQSRDKVRILLYGETVRAIGGQGVEQQHRFEQALAECHATGTVSLMEALDAVLIELRPGRPVVVITGTEGDPTIPVALATLRKRGLRPFLVAPPIWAEAATDGDGNAAVASRESLLRDLRAKGFPVYEAKEGIALDALFRIEGVPS